MLCHFLPRLHGLASLVRLHIPGLSVRPVRVYSCAGTSVRRLRNRIIQATVCSAPRSLLSPPCSRDSKCDMSLARRLVLHISHHLHAG